MTRHLFRNSLEARVFFEYILPLFTVCCIVEVGKLVLRVDLSEESGASLEHTMSEVEKDFCEDHLVSMIV